MSNTETPAPVQGLVEAAVTRHAALITETKTTVLAGQRAALSSAVYVAITMAAMVYCAPEKEQIKAVDARLILTGNLKATNDANDDFIQRTFSAGQALALYLKKNPPVYAKVMQANTYENGVNAVLAHLASAHGIRDRKALVAFLRGTPTKAVKLHPGSDMANAVVRKLATADASDFGKALAMGLAPETRAAVHAAFNAAIADLLVQAGPLGDAENPPSIEGRTGTEG